SARPPDPGGLRTGGLLRPHRSLATGGCTPCRLSTYHRTGRQLRARPSPCCVTCVTLFVSATGHYTGGGTTQDLGPVPLCRGNRPVGNTYATARVARLGSCSSTIELHPHGPKSMRQAGTGATPVPAAHGPQKLPPRPRNRPASLPPLRSKVLRAPRSALSPNSSKRAPSTTVP